MLIFPRDTAGKSRFESLGEMFLSEAMGVVFCFDISDRKSFSNLPHWMNKFIGNTRNVAQKQMLPIIDIKIKKLNFIMKFDFIKSQSTFTLLIYKVSQRSTIRTPSRHLW